MGKPSNVIVDGEHFGNVTLVDFELGGPNYRGFDLMKILRTDEKPSDNCIRHFLRAYAEAYGNVIGEATVSNLVTEVFMFEPLTWLEASIFFIVLPMFDRGLDTDQWKVLALDRWNKYTETK